MNFIRSILARARSVLRYLRAHLKSTIAVLVVLFFGFIAYAATRPSQPVFVTATAERGDLRQLVEAVGTVISEKDLDLQFPMVDVVSHVYVKEGDKVHAGQRLAALRSGSLSANIAGASANVQSAQAALNQMLEGSRPEDIMIAEAQVANKRASLEAAKQTLKNAEDNIVTAHMQMTSLKSEAMISLSGQVGTTASAVLQHLSTSKTALVSTQGVYNANDVQDAVVKGLPSGYETMQANITTTLSDINALETSVHITDYQTAIQTLSRARTTVSVVSDILSRAYDIMTNLPLTSYFTNTSRETNKSTLATQKSSVQSALSSLDTTLKSLRDASAGFDTRITSQQSEIISLQGTRDRAKADIATYETSLTIDEAQLQLKRAPARPTDIQGAQARVRQAQAELARAAAQYNDTILTAPVDGIVTTVNVKPGEMRPSSLPSVSLLGNSPYRIEMFVSEVDIPKIKLSQSGSITLDAFRNVNFAIHVSEIDQTATDKDGVPKYRVKLDFVFPHDNLKVGMTGDAEIVTGFRPDVVSVPQRAVLENDGTFFVRIQKDGNIIERTVTTGMEGEGGNIEVTGVEEGETVIVLEKK